MADADRSGLPPAIQKLLRITHADTCEDIARLVLKIESSKHKGALAELAKILFNKQQQILAEGVFVISDPTVAIYAREALRECGNRAEVQDVFNKVLDKICTKSILEPIELSNHERAGDLYKRIKESRSAIVREHENWTHLIMEQGRYQAPAKSVYTTHTQLV